jgi:hypothetical protein
MLLAMAVLSAACKQTAQAPSPPQQTAHPSGDAGSTTVAVVLPKPRDPTLPIQPPRTAAQQLATPQQNLQQPPTQPSATPAGAPQLEDVEVRRGPFRIAGQDFTVFLHYKWLQGKTDPDSEALASLEIRDAAGAVHHREAFPYGLERGIFSDSCAASAQLLSASNGTGLLISTECLPSAPLSGGPWQLFGVVNGKLVPFGKPLITEGEMLGLVPGAVSKNGKTALIRPDVIEFRVWTGNFFVIVPVRVDWMQGKWMPAQRCFRQTGHGMAEAGCDMRVETERRPSEQELTFVRLFEEADEYFGTPAHVVIKKDSKIEFLAARALVSWREATSVISLDVSGDVWLKVRIDGKEGWIHTQEDFNAIGLPQTG